MFRICALLSVCCFFIYAASTHDILKRVDFLLANNDRHTALSKLEAYTAGYPQDIQARGKLFELYVQYGLLDKAEKELNLLLKFHESLKHLIYKTHYLLAAGDLDSAEKTAQKILGRDNRAIEAKLALAEIYEKRKHLTLAERTYREIMTLNPRHKESLNRFTAFLLNQGKFPETSKILKSFKKIHPEAPEYFFLEAKKNFLLKKNSEALSFIKRALYYRPDHPPYRQLKREIQFALKNFKLLIRDIEKDHALLQTAHGNFSLAYFHYRKSNRGLWEMPDADYNKINFWPPLFKALELRENWELARFFSEEIAMRNYPGRDLNRIQLAQYHLRHARQYLDHGEYKKAYPELIRLLELEPRNLTHRMLFASYHKAAGHPASYLEELRLIQALESETDFELDTRIEKLTLNHKKRLAVANKIDQFSQRHQRNKLLILLPFEIERKNFDPLEQVYEKMVAFRFRLSPVFETVFGKANELEESIRMHQADYYLTLSLKEYPLGIHMKAHLYKASTQSPVKNQAFYSEGNFAHFEIFFPLIEFLEALIPVKGQILKMHQGKIFIDMGFRNGLSTGDLVSFFPRENSAQKIADAEIATLDEYAASVVLKDPEKSRYLKSGDLAVHIGASQKQ